MTEEELRGMMQDAARKVKEESVPAMTGVLMDTFQHGLEEGMKMGCKIAADRAHWWLVMNMTSATYMGVDGSTLSKPEFLERFKKFMEGGKL